MAYTKTTWADRIVQTPLTYTVGSPIVANTPFTLIPSEGTVTQSGTPLTAANLNNIEQGIADLDANKVNDTGDTMTGKLNLNVGGETIALLPSTLDHAYLSLYARTATPGTRSGYLGYGGTGTNDFTLANSISGGNILLLPTGIGQVAVGGTRLYFRNRIDTAERNFEATDFGLYMHYNDSDYARIISGGFDLIWNNSQYFNFKPENISCPVGNLLIKCLTGYTVVQSNGASQPVYLQSPVEIRCVAPNTTATFKPILASAFTVNSAREDKTNIEDASKGALQKVLKTKVYDYHLDNEVNEIEFDEEGKEISRKPKEKNKVKKRKGLILDEAPQDLIFGDENPGIDLYAMNSLLWQAVQELFAELKELKATLIK